MKAAVVVIIVQGAPAQNPTALRSTYESLLARVILPPYLLPVGPLTASLQLRLAQVAALASFAKEQERASRNDLARYSPRPGVTVDGQEQLHSR